MSRPRKQLTDEMLRILRAVERGTLHCNERGRYIIEDAARRPDRRSRELLVQRGYLKWNRNTRYGRTPYVLSDLGREAVAS